jgi:nucleoside 2-deoxyribosyltransferase
MDKNEITVFIGGPIQNAIESNGSFDIKLKQLIKNVISISQTNGYKVLSAHVYENFGEMDVSGKYAEVCRRDFNWMKECDVFIAVFPLKPSGEIIHSSGTCVELGWASVLKKRIVIIRDSATSYSHLIAGLDAIADVKELFLNNTDFEVNLNQILSELKTSK